MTNPEIGQAKEVTPKTEALASRFHEDWRASRLLEDGSFEPRIKETKDQAWIEAHAVNQVDIANTDFEDLPEDWQRENRAAAEVAQGVIEQGILNHVDIRSNNFIEAASSSIHEAWLNRNGWATGSKLDTPYSQLPEEEKAKDRAQIMTAIELNK